MKGLYGSSAHAIAIAGCSLNVRLLQLFKAKGILTDEEITNIASAAETDARALGTTTGQEAATLLAKLGNDMGNA